MSVMPIFGLVFDMLFRGSAVYQSKMGRTKTHSRTDGNPSRFLFGGFIDLTIIHKLATALLSHQFGDRRCESCFAMIDVLILCKLAEPTVKGQVRTPMVPIL